MRNKLKQIMVTLMCVLLATPLQAQERYDPRVQEIVNQQDHCYIMYNVGTVPPEMTRALVRYHMKIYNRQMPTYQEYTAMAQERQLLFPLFMQMHPGAMALAVIYARYIELSIYE